ncbi:non-hydrolyzing UDP-N-acetylglucosamine 2-epimerase [Spirosoma pollinicola]|uniref:UDP-N-acetylglucosamine 2-epimerase (Non-hydrolyzing) n=1 Tax=Spirosoma pollinicola TaxID=2057025 RepID=A0A2K8Z6P6_9BACT|nr:UDP-N-acetylglucosamine 2-epimerase (non-hydrolyzing) [Spirosoma pollinicola]AUD05543.1 UDP-N-acetylglucosamine 2-epimerase (non-hydrolyzing) [Spirosoma pollinicola]
MKILSVVGARPNFMKVAPLHRAFLNVPGIQSKIVHTGQHYDARLSAVFIQQLDLPQPDYSLNVRAGTPEQQMAEIRQTFAAVIRVEQPDWVLVVGDVTSTLACAQIASKMGVQVAHVEAGLRSGDGQMPEEINRIQTDALADLLFVTEQAGLDNLRREGVANERVHFVGNVMIDSLVQYRRKAAELNTLRLLGLSPRNYVLMTMHRPVNVDTRQGLEKVLKLVKNTAFHKTVVFPLHPRTRASLTRLNLMPPLVSIPNLRLLEPQGYLEFLNLMEHAAIVLTDSGGIQEETTYLNVPCLTFRDTTERPVTIELGTNQLLADLEPETTHQKLLEVLNGRAKVGRIPPLWDGKTAGRIAKILYTTAMHEV